MDNVIKKIVLDIDGKEISLTPEQARKLHAALDELLGEKQRAYVTVAPAIRPWYPVWWYSGTYASNGVTGTYDSDSSSVALTVN